MSARLAYIAGLENWNVLATAKEGQHRRLSRLLRPFGDFRRTRFLGLFVGRVGQPLLFFEELVRLEADRPGILDPISKLLPIDKTIKFSVDDFDDRLKEALLPYAEQIQNGSFYVRIERRGHKGEIHSQHLEQGLGRVLIEQLRASGYAPSLNFKDPDLILVVETLDDTCGLAALPRDLRDRFPFIRVP
jgi:tRNA(Ser,Leu) C12 N-acetylase TAN1